MPTLADIYSAIDSAKRKGSDFVRNPGASLQQMVGLANDRAGALNELTYQAAMEGGSYGPKSQQLANQMAEAYNPIGMTVKTPAYGIGHRPMTIEQGAAPLHDLSKAFDETIYGKEAMQNFGTGSPRLDKEALQVFQQAKNNPDAQITIYRAIPKDMTEKSINPGDWVTVSREYAMEHGNSALGGKYKLISQKVPASHVTTNADSILEQGYYPRADKPFEIIKSDASQIFGRGAERVKYTDPHSKGTIEMLVKPDGTASVLGLEVPEKFRGLGIGKSLQAKAMQDFTEMQGQVSSKAAATTAYKLGRRPPFQPNATLNDVFKLMDENSSVNLVSPKMQSRFQQEQ